LSITSTGAFSLTFGSSNDSGQTNPRFILGFNGGVISSVGNAITAPNAVQITGPNYVYLNSTQLGSITQTFLPLNSINLQSGQKGPQIARIPIQCNPGDVSYYTDPAPEKWFDFFVSGNFDSLDLYLTLGSVGVQLPLDMKGVSWSVKIGVLAYRKATDMLYKKPARSGNKVISL